MNHYGRLATELLSEFRNKTGSLDRLEQFVKDLKSESSARSQNSDQNPELFLFPDLPSNGWHDPKRFSWIPKLEAEASTIRDEVTKLMGLNGIFNPYLRGMNDLKHRAQKFNLTDQSEDWTVFHLRVRGQPRVDNARRCPETIRIVESAFAKDAKEPFALFFSVLKPGSHIPAHCGYVNTRLTFHLGVIVPEGCSMRVGRETRGWQVGKVLIFDDSFEHEVWHRGTETRVVLLGTVWHPDLTALERNFLVQLAERVDQLSSEERTAAMAALRKRGA